jgi:hypothetical protein
MRQLASLVLILSLTSAHAQQAPPLKQRGSTKLEDLLDTLGKDFDAYIAAVPNVICAEHIRSGIYENSSIPSTTFEAAGYFRVQRTFTPEGRVKFIESHSIKTINGKPAKEDGLKKAPLLGSGMFSYGFAILAPQYRHCFDFTEMALNPKFPETIFILFTDKPSAPRDETCPDFPITKGLIYVDGDSTRAGMHLRGISFTIPHSHAVPGIDTESRWGVYFAPSSIDTQAFLMPYVAGLEVRTNGAPSLPYPPIFGPGWEGPGDHKSLPGKRWIFSATYTNYRKLPATQTLP